VSEMRECRGSVSVGLAVRCSGETSAVGPWARCVCAGRSPFGGNVQCAVNACLAANLDPQRRGRSDMWYTLHGRRFSSRRVLCAAWIRRRAIVTGVDPVLGRRGNGRVIGSDRYVILHLSIYCRVPPYARRMLVIRTPSVLAGRISPQDPRLA
jgi:hypothetical protein